LQSLQVELSDISDELERINNTIQYSQERIQIVNDRILMGYKLLKKHQVKTTDELLFIKNELAKKMTDIVQIGDSILQKQRETELLLLQCEKIAKQVSTNRYNILPFFEEKVNTLLVKVGMPNARFKVALTNGGLTEHGTDAIEFLFNANLPTGETVSNKRFEPLRKVASGGELSRIMLCVKSLVAKKLQLPTLIFDEIDTGISGEAAKQVGEIMKSLSIGHQVISITHQPQIAAKATAHYFVYKATIGNKITTSIKQLNDDERITAIAQMLSGEKPTAAALENAREMVYN
jgi:DNA repair protein RecN (Recombination protein N)